MFPPEITTFIFDMDGVTNLGDSPIPGASETINALQKSGRNVYFLTNNSSRSRSFYKTKMAGFGIKIDTRYIFTSAYAAALYLAANGAVGKTAFIVGENGLAEELESVGIKAIVATDTLPYTQIDYVVVGIDRQFTYDKLKFAHLAVTRNNATLIATNRDATYPTEDGEIPGGGSIVASVATAVGKEPITIGKPEPFALEMILRDAGVDVSSAAMVGDRLDTDIAAGNNLNMHTVLVLTGVTTLAMAKNAPDLWRPTTIIGTLPEILQNT